MNAKPRAALLPLYLELYDRCVPEARAELAPFPGVVAEGIEARGVEIARCPICCTRPEFAAAVDALDPAEIDLLITLHLAYSPSLESADVLARAPLPILMLDTTPDCDFGPDVDPSRIMHNHGVHGLQDLACMLRRRGKPYEIVAGHWQNSDVLARAAAIARAAHAARRLRSTRALRIGEPFRGMGDFSVDDSTMRRVLGIKTAQIAPADLAPACEAVSAQAIEEEVAADRRRFNCLAGEAVHRDAVRLGLGLRRYLDENRIDAFSMNFLAFDTPDGPVSSVPFLEASKAMARGIGYAGEGDVLTASLVGALLRGFERVTFTEIFCPDWKGERLFLSHMGEFNPAIAAGTPVLRERDWPFTRARKPAFITCAPAPGPAVLVNLAPGPIDSFSLVIAPLEVQGDATNPKMHESLRAWVKPRCPVAEFLERYSRAGGTHHSALVPGAQAEAMAAFARFAGIEPVVIQGEAEHEQA